VGRLVADLVEAGDRDTRERREEHERIREEAWKRRVGLDRPAFLDGPRSQRWRPIETPPRRATPGGTLGWWVGAVILAALTSYFAGYLSGLVRLIGPL